MPPKRKPTELDLSRAPEAARRRESKRTALVRLRRKCQAEWDKHGADYLAINDKGVPLAASAVLEDLYKHAEDREDVYYILPARMDLYRPKLSGPIRFLHKPTDRRVYNDTYVGARTIQRAHVTALNCIFSCPLRNCMVTATDCVFEELSDCDLAGDNNYIAIARNSNVIGTGNRVECLHESAMQGEKGSVGVAIQSHFDTRDTFVDTNFDKIVEQIE